MAGARIEAQLQLAHSHDLARMERCVLVSSDRIGILASSKKTREVNTVLRFACQQAEALGHTLRQIQIGRAHTDIKTTQGYLKIDEIPVSQVIIRLPEKA